ncbi:uncharacterized protein LOC123988490 [Osmia bicornis bicornis]|uniref:uncharacterized protein LOC123988490 n=1 Tax=Osmia bicornis bicornis TaxID=1437191 RepID=UPI001EAF28B0|nr:uncharacterized protein LOC123988490 [Osmia bicornis bicornis]
MGRPQGTLSAGAKRTRGDDTAVPMTAGCLPISQINLQHCKAATDLLRWRLAAQHTDTQKYTDIALIQEPWLIQGQVGGLDLKQGSIFHGDLETGPRACVYAKRGLGATKLAEFCTRDQAAVLLPAGVGGSRANLVVCSTYQPYDSEGPPPTRELRELADYCKVKGLQLVIGGSSPAFVTSRRREVLDITLGSANAAQAIQDWRVEDEATLSDHRLITFKLKTNADLRASESYRNPRATCWPQYRESLEGELRGHCVIPMTTKGIEMEVARLQTSIIGSYERSCSLKQRRESKRVPWWNNELNKLRARARKLLNKAMKANTAEAWDAYKEAQKAYKKTIRVSKRRTWKNFCQETEALPLVARLRKVFVSGPPQKPEGLKLPNGGVTGDSLQTLRHLMETHFPGSELIPEELFQKEQAPLRNSARDWELASKVVTIDRLRWAINSFSRYKSPGVDGIFPALL